MIVYPYRYKKYRSILEAVDRDDANSWLNIMGGGVVFCEVEMGMEEFVKLKNTENKDEIVDRLLSENERFVPQWFKETNGV